jgi:hypothetical protein
MVEIEQDLQAHSHEIVRLGVVQIGDEADAAGVMLVARIIEALGRGQTVGGRGVFRQSFSSKERRAKSVRPVLLVHGSASFNGRLCSSSTTGLGAARFDADCFACPAGEETSKWSATLSYLSARDIARLGSATQDMVAHSRRDAKVFFELGRFWEKPLRGPFRGAAGKPSVVRRS